MKKTIFSISKMDCSTEEQIVRMKLDGMSNIVSMNFDLAKRKLEIIHSEDYLKIFDRLKTLNLNTKFISSENFNSAPLNSQTEIDTKILQKVLSINFFFFAIEIIFGLIANSMGLVADSLDMLADSIVYGISLYAVKRSLQSKKRVASISGYFQLLLASLGFVEVINRFIDNIQIPSFYTMIIVSLFALAGNSLSLILLQKSKTKEVHIQASMIFTSNDVIVNIGVIIAGLFVHFTNSKYPDLIIGLIIFSIVAQGAIRILRLSK